MSLGIPIICNIGVGDVDIIMKKCMPELLIKEFSDKEYKRVLNLVFDNYIINKSKIINTSKAYFSLSQGVNKYLNIYSKVLN